METIVFYRDRADGTHPIYDNEARRRDPNTLFGTPLMPEDWDKLDIDPVYAGKPPEYDTDTHELKGGAIEQIDGAWFQPWVVVELPPPPPRTIAADVLFDRMTDDEYDALDESVRAGESARVYRGWSAATSFTEGTAMWSVLDKHLALVVSGARRAELLAP